MIETYKIGRKFKENTVKLLQHAEFINKLCIRVLILNLSTLLLI